MKSSNTNDIFSDTDLDQKAYPIVRSHSVSSTSTGQRPHSLESDTVQEPHKNGGEKSTNHAQSLIDVSGCDNPNCNSKKKRKIFPQTNESYLVRNRHQRHSIPGHLSSYLRLCSVADLPQYGKLVCMVISH